MKLPQIDLWAALGKVAGIGAFTLLAYRTVYPESMPKAEPVTLPAPPVHVEPTGRVHVEEVPVADEVTDDAMGWDFVRPSETGAIAPTREPTRDREPINLPEENGILMTNILVGGNWDKSLEDAGVPAAISGPILASVDGAKNQAFLTALCWQETRYNSKAIRKASGDDGGHSKGPWQVHDYWAEKTAKHARETGMEAEARAIMAGISEDVTENLNGVRALIKVQKQWGGGGGFHDIASYYNEGGSWKKAKGQRYADNVMDKYAELLPIYESQG
jgi:hypothetical protein